MKFVQKSMLVLLEVGLELDTVVIYDKRKKQHSKKNYKNIQGTSNI